MDLQKFERDAQCTHAEATYYLEDANWDVPKALQQFYSDREWEKANPDKHSMSFTVDASGKRIPIVTEAAVKEPEGECTDGCF
jgi:hypothetical protein